MSFKHNLKDVEIYSLRQKRSVFFSLYLCTKLTLGIFSSLANIRREREEVTCSQS